MGGSEYKRGALTGLLGSVLGEGGEIDHYEWEVVFPFLALHQVTPFLYEAVAGAPAAVRPPDGIMELWSSEYYGQVVKDLRLAQQRDELLSGLHEAGVEVVPLKGSWLATKIYTESVKRPMDDIDLLIRPEQIEAARGVVARLGYRSKGDVDPGGFAKGQGFAHPEMPAPIELQWSLFHESHGKLPPVEMGYIWQRTRAGEIGGVAVRLLEPATHLIYLIYHIQAHLWRFMARAQLDIVLCGRKLEGVLTVAQVRAEAEAWGLGFRAPFVWQVAHDVCGVEPPGGLGEWSAEVLPLVAERRHGVAVALPESNRAESSTRMLHRMRAARWWRKPGIAWRALMVDAAQIRDSHAVAVRRGGLVAGYSARALRLLKRYNKELWPGSGRREGVVEVEGDMAERLWLESWCAEREKARLA